MHVEIPIIDLTEEDNQSEVTITEIVNEHGCSDVGKVDFFERVPHCADREKASSDVLSSSVLSYMGDFVVHEARDWCANLHASLVRDTEIPLDPPGNCLFYSLIKSCNLKITAIELRS